MCVDSVALVVKARASVLRGVCRKGDVISRQWMLFVGEGLCFDDCGFRKVCVCASLDVYLSVSETLKVRTTARLKV